MIWVVLISFVTSYCLGKSPFRVFDSIRFKYVLLLITPFLVQVTVYKGLHIKPEYSKFALILSSLTLCIGIFYNRHIKGLKWILVGIVFNLIGILINGGSMPVWDKATKWAYIENLPSGSRHSLTGFTSPLLLGDWIPLYKKVISIGDVFVSIGILLFIILNSPSRSKNERDKLLY